MRRGAVLDGVNCQTPTSNFQDTQLEAVVLVVGSWTLEIDAYSGRTMRSDVSAGEAVTASA